MGKNRIKRFALYVLLIAFATAVMSCGGGKLDSVEVYPQFKGVSYADRFKVWAVGIYDKVSSDENYESQNYIWDGEAVTLYCGKGEVESFQLLIGAEFGNINDVTVEFDGLKNPDGGEIPGDDIELFFEYYISCENPSDADGWAGKIADPLVPLDGKFDLAKATCQPILVRITIPPDANPGLYTGKITVKADGATSESVIVDLEVADVSIREYLPDFFVTLDPRIIAPWHGLAASDGKAVEVIEEYEALLLSRGAKPTFASYPELYNTSSEGKAAEKWAERVALAGETGYGKTTIIPVLETIEGGLPDIETIAADYSRLYKALEKSAEGDIGPVALWVHAPGGSSNPFDKEAIDEKWWGELKADMAQWPGEPKLFAEASPLRAMPPALDLQGKVDYWITPFADCTADPARIVNTTEGDIYLDITDSGVANIDTRGLASVLLGWYGYLFAAEGAIIPPMTPKKPYRPENPWSEDPMVSDGDDWGNGMSTLIYPGGPAGVDGPVSTLRLEQLQQSIENWALLRALEEKRGRDYVVERLQSRLPMDIENPRQIKSRDMSASDVYEIRKMVINELGGAERIGHPLESSGKIVTARGTPVYNAWVGDQYFGTYTNEAGEYTLHNSATPRGGFTVIASGFGTGEVSGGMKRGEKMYRTLRGLVKVFDFETEYVVPGHWLAGDEDDALMVERSKDTVYDGIYSVRFDFPVGRYSKAVNLYPAQQGFTKYHRIVFPIYNPNDYLVDLDFLMADDVDFDLDDQYKKRLILRPRTWNMVNLRVKTIRKREELTFAIGSSGRYAMKRSYTPDLDEIEAIGFSFGGLEEYGAPEGEKVTIYLDDVLLLMYPE